MCVEVKWGELKPQISWSGEENVFLRHRVQKNQINTTYPRDPASASETCNRGGRQMEKDLLSYFHSV